MKWCRPMIVRVASTDSSNQTVAFPRQFAALTTALKLGEESASPLNASTSAPPRENNAVQTETNDNPVHVN